MTHPSAETTTPTSAPTPHGADHRDGGEFVSATTTAFVDELAERCAELASETAAAVGVVELGRVPYRPVWAVQTEWIRRRRETPTNGKYPDVILVVEHEPVFTVTKRAKANHVRWNPAEMAARGAETVLVDRGGDVTFHGPGQLVMYPLLDLQPMRLGAGAYMHALETTIIAALAQVGITAHTEAGKTGVWVAPTSPPSTPTPTAKAMAAKICALGVRVSRGLTKHGLALNVTTDLEWFSGIVPCGLPLPVTSVAEQVGASPCATTSTATALWTTIVEHVVTAFSKTFRRPTVSLAPPKISLGPS